MIHHMVFLRLKASTDEAYLQKIFAELDAIRLKKAGAGKLVMGKDCHLDPIDNRFTHGVYMEFKDDAARCAYLFCSEHEQWVQENLLPLLDGDVQESVMVFDIEA